MDVSGIFLVQLEFGAQRIKKSNKQLTVVSAPFKDGLGIATDYSH